MGRVEEGMQGHQCGFRNMRGGFRYMSCRTKRLPALTPKRPSSSRWSRKRPEAHAQSPGERDWSSLVTNKQLVLLENPAARGWLAALKTLPKRDSPSKFQGPQLLVLLRRPSSERSRLFLVQMESPPPGMDSDSPAPEGVERRRKVVLPSSESLSGAMMPVLEFRMRRRLVLSRRAASPQRLLVHSETLLERHSDSTSGRRLAGVPLAHRPWPKWGESWPRPRISGAPPPSGSLGQLGGTSPTSPHPVLPTSTAVVHDRPSNPLPDHPPLVASR